MTPEEMQAQMEIMRKEFEAKFLDMEHKFNSLNKQVQTINHFVSAMTAAQGFEQTISEIESVAKQVTGCENARFYCFDKTDSKFFSQGERGRQWISADGNSNIVKAFEQKNVIANGEKAAIPIVSSTGESLGVIYAEKKSGFKESDFKSFEMGSQIANTVDLALKKEFEHQGKITDELTKLKNRQGLNEYLENTVCGKINDGKTVNIVMCDIDHFKNVNDTYGHDAGDEILKGVAKIIQAHTRGDDCTFRMGGEEMIMMLHCEPEQAIQIAERCRKAVEAASFSIKQQDGEIKNISVTVSMGVSPMQPAEEMTVYNARAIFDSEFKKADEFVYAAKETGRNKVVTSNEVQRAYTAMKAAEFICGKEGGVIDEIKTTVADCISKGDFKTVIEAMQGQAEQIPESIAEEVREAAESKPKQSYDIFGTTAYSSLVDKKYLTVYNRESADKLTERLESANIPFSGRIKENGEITITVSGWQNRAAAQKIINDINKDYIMGNATKYADIQNKTYINADEKTVVQIAEQAHKEAVPYSAKLDGEKSALTVDGKESKDFIDRIKNMQQWADKVKVREAMVKKYPAKDTNAKE